MINTSPPRTTAFIGKVGDQVQAPPVTAAVCDANPDDVEVVFAAPVAVGPVAVVVAFEVIKLANELLAAAASDDESAATAAEMLAEP
ncbi:hypothetical protein OIDMADRAFT_20072 [Oidiodendron maius Zn]|uniref:Uncharacterized protein n=1 Tax=Oidiodendron maius (strain Zn) TaxID=913774 RepID=A0A0C3CHG0_OIDMZ|nr:hypothetical protein OIDMADRAFT_20072 [Oidiodendron maius Zn]